MAIALFNGKPLFSARADIPIMRPSASEAAEQAIPAYTTRGGDGCGLPPVSYLEKL